MKSFQFFWNRQRDREARIATLIVFLSPGRKHQKKQRDVYLQNLLPTLFSDKKSEVPCDKVIKFFFPVCFQCLYLFPLHHSCPLFVISILIKRGLPWWLSGKESSCQCKWCRFDPWFGMMPWKKKWQPTPVFLPRKSNRGCWATVHGVAQSWTPFSYWTTTTLTMIWSLHCTLVLWILSVSILRPAEPTVTYLKWYN